MPAFQAHKRLGLRRNAHLLLVITAAILLSACNAGKTSSVREALLGSVDKPTVAAQHSSREPETTSTSTRKRSALSSSGISSRQGVSGKPLAQPGSGTNGSAGDVETVQVPSSSPRYPSRQYPSKQYPTKQPPQKLSWHPPLTREDGTSLYPGEIQGYRIYFKKAHHGEFKTIPLKDANETSLSLDGFSPGVYQFSISTIDTNGLESRRSATVRVNVT